MTAPVSLLDTQSPAEELAGLSTRERSAVLNRMTTDQAQALLYDWHFWARPKQIAPEGEWFGWLLLGGRGSGKTRSAAEWIRSRVESGKARAIALVGKTDGDVRDIQIQGDSGIIACSSPAMRPTYTKTTRRLDWPNGAYALCFSGEDPDQLRGPQFDTAWVDELAKYHDPQTVWDNLEFGLRLGVMPQVCISTTPRPIKLIRDLVKDPMVRTVQMSSYENLSNLSPWYIKRVIKKYEGTRLGRQELYAHILADTPGALWTTAMLDECRVEESERPEMKRIVIGVDPQVKKLTGAKLKVVEEGTGRETGIVVCGLGDDGRGYVLKDASGNYSPGEWGRIVVSLYNEFSADRVIGERNNGGELVELNVRTLMDHISYEEVWASQNKGGRAEPVAALMEQKKIKHVGMFPAMEDQMLLLTPEEYLGTGSPDRVDAMVWAMRNLMLKEHASDNPDDYVDYRR